MKVKNNKATATLTDVKNRIGDVFSLVDDLGEVTITSYNKPTYVITKFDKEKEETETKAAKPEATQEKPDKKEQKPEPEVDTKFDIFLSPEPKITESAIAELPEPPVIKEISSEKEKEFTQKEVPQKEPKLDSKPEPALEIKPENLNIEKAENVQIEVNQPSQEETLASKKKSDSPKASLELDEIEAGLTGGLSVGDTYEEVPIAPPVNETLTEENKNYNPNPQTEAPSPQKGAYAVEEEVTILANTTYSDLWNRANVKEKAWVEAARNLL